jgi:hypothetical protein
MNHPESRSRRLPFGLALAVLVSVAATGGCSSSSRRTADSPFDTGVGPGQPQVPMRVENRNLHDATLFLRIGDRRHEIGTVSSRGVAFFDLPWSPDRPLDLEIQLSVGERYRLPPYPFSGAGRLELTIASELRRSILRS